MRYVWIPRLDLHNNVRYVCEAIPRFHVVIASTIQLIEHTTTCVANHTVPSLDHAMDYAENWQRNYDRALIA